MKKIWYDKAWDQYLYWQTHDRSVLKKLNELIKETERTPFRGKGKPEPLKHDLSGCFSRRITDKDRLVYRVENGVLEILSCKNHYDD